MFLARPLHSKKRSGWNYPLRQLARPQRQGCHGRHGPGGRQLGAHGRGGGASRRRRGALRVEPGGVPESSLGGFGFRAEPGGVSGSCLGRFRYPAAHTWRSHLGVGEPSGNTLCFGGLRGRLSAERALQSSVFVRGSVDLQPRESAEWAPP